MNAIDLLPRSFEGVTLNYLTCLSLPFIALVSRYNSSSTSDSSVSSLLNSHPGLAKLLASDVFLYDPPTSVIRLRPQTSITSRTHRNLILLAIRLTNTGKVHFHSFFSNHFRRETCNVSILDSNTTLSINFTSFILNRIQLPDSTDSTSNTTPLRTTLSPLSPTYYKQLVTTTSQPTFNNYFNVRPRQWSLFWSLPIPLNSRTTWYRALHQKIPTKSLLHRYFPLEYTSPNCSLCAAPSDDQFHFLFTCPTKLRVWTTVLTEYIFDHGIPTALDVPSILQLLFSLSHPKFNRSSQLPFPTLSIYQIFACTLQAIWRAHWQFIFYETPFTYPSTLQIITKLLTKLHTEESQRTAASTTPDDYED